MKIKQATYALLAVSGTFLSSSTLLGQGPALDAASTSSPTLQPRVLPEKLAKIAVPTGARQDILAVQFKSGRKLRAYGGRVYDMTNVTAKANAATNSAAGAAAVDFTSTQPVLAGLQGYWYPLHTSVTEGQIDAMRVQGQVNSGAELPDLNAAMLVTVPAGTNIQEMANSINGLDEVEYVEPVVRPVSTTPPNFEPVQDYLEPLNGNTGRLSGNGIPAGGLDANYVWNTFATRGKNPVNGKVNIAVIELNANLAHIEMSKAQFVGGGAYENPARPNANAFHGTAVASIITGRNDGVGTTGFASNASFFIAYDGQNTVADILMATYNAVGNGGIVSVSQGRPLDPNNPNSVVLPLTYDQATYNTVSYLIQNGCSVFLAAGNSGVFIDAYDPPHHPFTQPGMISGLVYVGAGTPPGGGQAARSRAQFTSDNNPAFSSNYGGYVMMQGWGFGVETASTVAYASNVNGAGYGSEGDNLAYTDNFNGTSAATPMVAGAAALLQAANLKQMGYFLTPNQLKQKLKKTGTPQVDGYLYPKTQKIGRQPNLQAATFYLLPPAQQSAYVPQPDPATEPTTPAYNYPPYRPPGQEPYEP